MRARQLQGIILCGWTATMTSSGSMAAAPLSGRQITRPAELITRGG
jgi:hypothetical protein